MASIAIRTKLLPAIQYNNDSTNQQPDRNPVEMQAASAMFLRFRTFIYVVNALSSFGPILETHTYCIMEWTFLLCSQVNMAVVSHNYTEKVSSESSKVSLETEGSRALFGQPINLISAAPFKPTIRLIAALTAVNGAE